MIKYGPEGALEWEATYEAEEGDWALNQDRGVIIAVDSSQFGFLKLPFFRRQNDQSAKIDGRRGIHGSFPLYFPCQNEDYASRCENY